MIKKILAITLVGGMLLFSGCANDDGESRLETQQMLDSGDYEGVILKLESIENKTEEEYLALASAYMGSSGLGFADLVSVMAESNDADEGGDGFASFATSISENSSDTALSDLGKAIENYEAVVGDVCSVSDTNLTNSQKDICLFIGLSSTMKAATTLSYLGDLADFGSASDDELTASTCAMQYAYEGDSVSIDEAGNCRVVEGNSILFDSNNTYTELSVTVIETENTFEYFMTTDSVIGQTIITDGNCNVAFETADCDQNTSTPSGDCHVCPVNQDPDAEELTVANILVEVLDSGLDSIISTMGADSDIAADVEVYKEDVQDENGTITIESIIDYLNLQNLGE